MVRLKQGCATIACVLFASAASAQLTTDQVPQGRIVPPAQQLRNEIESSRYHFSGVHVQPVLALRDFGYSGNVFGVGENETADWRATVGAGARLIVPAGEKTYLRLSAVPEYTWYRKLADRRGFGGRYDGSLLVLFNRMPLEFGVNQQRGVTSVSSEEERSVLTTRNLGFARIQLEILRRLSLFADAEFGQMRYSVTEADRLAGVNLEQLERNESAVRGGIRYQFRPALSVGVAAETTHADFIRAGGADNQTKATMFIVNYDRPQTIFNLAASKRTGEGENGSQFPKFSTTTGSYAMEHRLARGARFGVFGHRSLSYSLFDQNAYYVESRNGVSLALPVATRTALRFLADAGTNQYPSLLGSGRSARSDKAMTLGGGFAVRLHGSVVFATVATSTKYDSNIAEFDRTIVRVLTTLSFGGGDIFQ